jgi:hypothetical protein
MHPDRFSRYATRQTEYGKFNGGSRNAKSNALQTVLTYVHLVDKRIKVPGIPACKNPGNVQEDQIVAVYAVMCNGYTFFTICLPYTTKEASSVPEQLNSFDDHGRLEILPSQNRHFLNFIESFIIRIPGLWPMVPGHPGKICRQRQHRGGTGRQSR